MCALADVHWAAGEQMRADIAALPELQPGVRCRTGQAVITRYAIHGQAGPLLQLPTLRLSGQALSEAAEGSQV